MGRLIIILALCMISAKARAGLPVEPDVRWAAVTDSVPAQKMEPVKEVPKSRRKIKPLAIPAPVQVPIKPPPIKVIKPKIIRTSVGILR
ncbi:hypothetical protein ACWKWU_00415 [Chitinophaga lutea]